MRVVVLGGSGGGGGISVGVDRRSRSVPVHDG